MTQRLVAVTALTRHNQSGKLPDLQPGDVFDATDSDAAWLISGGFATAAAPGAVLSPRADTVASREVRGTLGLRRAVSN